MIGLSVPQNDGLRALIENLRAMADRYRKWASGAATEYQAEEFRQLADSSEQSANELAEILRQEDGH